MPHKKEKQTNMEILRKLKATLEQKKAVKTKKIK
jgi:hypothetical protein